MSSSFRDALVKDHKDLAADISSESEPNLLNKLERRYAGRPKGWRSKIGSLDIGMNSTITGQVRRHIIEHILFAAKRTQRRLRKRTTFQSFIRTQGEAKAHTKRFSFVKKPSGAVIKREKKTGHFAKLNKKERRAVERARKEARRKPKP